ncbi:MAG: hypothetical protein JW847_00560, partial [Candidatus Omnitrophica bacterium]|nr:hypothetical protein [Candidatus Omnitrophota bacterium]
LNGFQDRRFQPLSHLSSIVKYYRMTIQKREVQQLLPQISRKAMQPPLPVKISFRQNLRFCRDLGK